MRDWLSHRVVSSPDDVALIRASDGEAWSYADLDQLVAETAGRLLAHGIGPADRVGVLTPPYVGTVGLIHAAMRIGATLVPLGERLTPRELGERVDSADLSAVICAAPTESNALAAVDSVPVYSVDEPTTDAVRAVHGVDPEPVTPAEWSFDDRLCILFTSGTSGAPKPVPLTAGNVYSSAVASAFRLGLDPADRWLITLALHHMGGLAPVYRSALYGTTIVLREGFEPGETADDIDRYDVTGVSLVPTMLARMLDRRGTLSDSLRVVLLGGAPAPDELIERCRDYSIPVYPTYGMTEAASQVATATPVATRSRTDTVGRPLFGTDVTVVDEDGLPVSAGETGEIVVDGPTITPGYIGVDDPRDAFGPYGLHTGDAGRLDTDGYLYVLNRLDDRIITGGENVEPGEVSEVIREYPGVDDVAVVGLEDETWGERVAALMAVEDANGPDDTADDAARSTAEEGTDRDDPSVSMAPGDAIDDAALMSFTRDRLAGFKLPRTIAYTDELPRTVSGTIDREAVRERLATVGTDPRDGFGDDGFEPAEPRPPDRRDDATEEAAPERNGAYGERDSTMEESRADRSAGARTDLTTEALNGSGAEPAAPTDTETENASTDGAATTDDGDGSASDGPVDGSATGDSENA